MSDRLRHRGPDDSGQWVAPNLGTAISFRRLAVVDRSELGRQPMVSADGRFTLAVNGEIYNHRALRVHLEKRGTSFRGETDSEVLLEAISTWGLEPTLHRCVGMFALVLVDNRDRQLILARDRLGEKPLYYGWSNHQFFFGSELKAFRPHPAFTADVDRGALTLYLRHGYVPTPHCIFAGFHKLLPGSILTLPLDGTATPQKERIRRYWSVPRPEETSSFKGSPEDYVSGLEQLLGGAIRTQMLADVPVGAFLSGGTDSSTVVALMQSQSSARVKTFNIGFWDAALDESSYAARVAAHLGTDHTTLRCGDAELLELAREVGAIYCEPFADDAQIPTLALARLARQQVTVSLSGDGGDEVFRGYGRYVRTLRRWRQLQRYPAVRFGVRCGLDSLSWAADLLTESPLKRRMNCKLQKARNQWLAQHLPAYYRHRNSVVKNPDLFLRAPKPLADFFDDTGRLPQMKENVSWLSYLDMNTYLPDHVLVRVDRAAMAFGLETRMPLLDHRVVEYLATASEGLLRQDGKSKWPLRSLLARNIPLDLVERPKMGFSAPMTVWLRGPLREWAEDHLSPERLNRNDFFDGREVRRCWAEHQQGRKNHPLLLWNLLVFQAWHSSWN